MGIASFVVGGMKLEHCIEGGGGGDEGSGDGVGGDGGFGGGRGAPQSSGGTFELSSTTRSPEQLVFSRHSTVSANSCVALPEASQIN
jgi:hypothetical protein